MPSGRGFDPPEVASDARISATIEGFYHATREAVKAWGGGVALASLLEQPMSTVSERLNRREVKGALQRAFVEYAAIACTSAAGAESYLYALCDLLGFERPKRKRTKTVDEKLAALVKGLRLAGPLGEAAIKQAARELGADPAEFDL